jgi:hypothetical protein
MPCSVYAAPIVCWVIYGGPCLQSWPQIAALRNVTCQLVSDDVLSRGRLTRNSDKCCFFKDCRSSFQSFHGVVRAVSVVLVSSNKCVTYVNRTICFFFFEVYRCDGHSWTLQGADGTRSADVLRNPVYVCGNCRNEKLMAIQWRVIHT